MPMVADAGCNMRGHRGALSPSYALEVMQQTEDRSPEPQGAGEGRSANPPGKRLGIPIAVLYSCCGAVAYRIRMVGSGERTLLSVAFLQSPLFLPLLPAPHRTSSVIVRSRLVSSERSAPQSALRPDVYRLKASPEKAPSASPSIPCLVIAKNLDSPQAILYIALFRYMQRTDCAISNRLRIHYRTSHHTTRHTGFGA